MRKEASKPVWISHRGFKEAAVENTHAAFAAARELGFQALETDLRVTRDGAIVLHHDPDLRRLAGRADRVADLSRAELEKVPLAGGARLYFFDDFMRDFAGCAWTFDVKPETGAETVRRLKAWSDAHGAADLLAAQAKFVFWDARQEALCREVFPRAGYYARERECYRAGAAVRAGAPGLGGITKGRIYALTARLFGMPLFRREIAGVYQARGASVIAFLPADEAEARAAAAAGFDEILTNGPIYQ
jgi:glycerophosphoryl diester phosphodiesterase